MPYLGSVYMPAAHRLAALLAENQILPGGLHALVRVRFRMLDRIGDLDAAVRLPGYLHDAFGSRVVSSKEISKNYREIRREAETRLEEFRNPDARERWLRNRHSEKYARIESLERRKLEIIRRDSSDPNARKTWLEIRALKAELLASLIEKVIGDFQLSQLDFCDSRGGLYPWAVALAGNKFYRKILSEAEIYEEPG